MLTDSMRRSTSMIPESRNPHGRRRQSQRPAAKLTGSVNAKSTTCTGFVGSVVPRSDGGRAPASSAGSTSASHRPAKARAVAIR
ncbi:MAG: hypothetical protein DMD35_06675 [Gemmatimonadetes bacterium]|nr:MAG: hypothetical protein DMD35_06675 [Gemmatimonadota bacterium]